MDSAQSSSPRLVEETAFHSEEGSRSSFGAFFQTVHFWACKRFRGLFTKGGKSIRIAHDSVRSLGGMSTKHSNSKVPRTEGKPAQTSPYHGQLPSHSEWNPAAEPLLGGCNQNGDDGVDDKSPNEEPEIHAVYPWMGMDKVFWANTLAVGLGVLCTLAVVLTVYNSLDNALDDDDENF